MKFLCLLSTIIYEFYLKDFEYFMVKLHLCSQCYLFGTILFTTIYIELIYYYSRLYQMEYIIFYRKSIVTEVNLL